MITATMALLVAGGALIGFLLAVLGAGGSILLLPLLVSGAALPTKAAVPLSLLVVTLLALGNVGPYIRRRQVAVRPALVLGLPALAGSWIGGSLVKAGLIPEAMQLGIFTAAALLASWLLNRRSALKHPPNDGRPAGLPVALASQGVLVGLLTGIAGVGGGFAIVPALVLLAGLPMQLASGTSLLLIATNSLVALAALGHWPTAQLPLLFPLVGGGFLGAVRRPAARASPAGGAAAPGFLGPVDRLGAAHRIRGLATPRPPARRIQGCRQPPESRPLQSWSSRPVSPFSPLPSRHE